MAAHARDVNICIWTARKSVDDGTNDRVLIHGDVTRADGRRSRFGAPFHQDHGLGSWPSRAEHRGVSSNVVVSQAGHMARPNNKAPETQIYFINHRSGAFPVLRQRTVVRRERASQSMMKQTIVPRYMVIVEALLVAGSGTSAELSRSWARGVAEPPWRLRSINPMKYPLRPIIWPVPQLKRLKRKFIL